MVEIDPYDFDGYSSLEPVVDGLRAAIVDTHAREHEGAIQWCTHPLCKAYEEHR